MRNAGRLLLLGLAITSFGCGHVLTPKDLAGQWKADPATVKSTQGDAAQVLQSAVLTLSENGTYVFDYRSTVQLDGTWTLAQTAVSMQPAKVVLNFPQLPNGKLEMTPDELITKIGPILKQTPQGIDQLKSIQAIAQPLTLKAGIDGNTLTSADNMVWRKQGAGG